MGILDPKFRYTSAAATDLRKTFRRLRRQMRQQAEQCAQERREKVAAIGGARRKP